MNVARDDVVAVFKGLELKTADKWNEKRLRAKLSDLPDMTDDDTDLGDERLNGLLDDLLDAVSGEEEIEIEGFGKKKAAASSSQSSAKKSSKKATKSTKSTKSTKKKSSSPVKSAGGNGKPGIIASILEFLTAANSKKPITKKQIVAKLANRFKDREPESMQKTVNVQVPTRLSAEKGVEVQKNEHGYWVKG